MPTNETTQQLATRLQRLQERVDTLGAEAERARGRLEAADEELLTKWGCKTIAAAEKLLATKKEQLAKAEAAQAAAHAKLAAAVDALEAALTGGDADAR